MHNHYSSQMTQVTAQLKQDVQVLKGERQGLVTKIAELEANLEAFAGSTTSNSTAQALQKQLDECRSKLNIRNETIKSKEATIQSLQAQLRSRPDE